MTVKPFIRLIVLTFGIAAISTNFAEAQTTDIEDLSLEDLLNVKITTVSKNSQRAGDAPASVIVVKAQQIKTRGYRNLAELLNDLPDVKVNDKSDPQYFNAFNIRGINGQDHFVILLDGIKISSPTNDPLPILENYPIYLAKQIEVVFGPGSALYGADAMAGVINIITNKDIDNDIIQVSGMAGTYGYTNAQALFRKALSNDFKLTVGGQYSYDKQPDFSKVYPKEYPMQGQQTGTFNSSYGTMNPIQPIDPDYSAPVKTYNAYLALEKDGFEVKLLRYYAQVPASTALRSNNAVYNKDVFYGHGITTANIAYTDSIGSLKSVTNLQGSFYEVNPKSNFRNLYGGIEHGYKYANGSMMKLEEQLSTAVSENILITGGITYEIFKSLPKSMELADPQVKGTAVTGIILNSPALYNPGGIPSKSYMITYNNFGSYLQGQFTPLEKLVVTAGMRYDHNSRFGSTINPRMGLVYNQSSKTIIKALYGTAYWAPSPHITYEQYGSFYSTDEGRTYKSDFWHLPNSNLKPITSQTTEFSINHQFEKVLNVIVTAYHTRLNNLISNTSDQGNTNLYNNSYLGYPVAYIEVPVNNGVKKIYGGNINVNTVFNVRNSKFNIWSSLSVVDGTINRSNNSSSSAQIPLIAPIQVRAGIDAYAEKLSYSMRIIHSGKQRVNGFINPGDPDKRQLLDGYTLMNAAISYTWKEHFTFFAKAENALDRRYLNAITMSDGDSALFHGAFQDPLRIMAGLTFRFE